LRRTVESDPSSSPPPWPVRDQLEAFQDDRQAPRLVDEIHRAPFERRLLVDLLAEHGQEDDGRFNPRLAQRLEHAETVDPWHSPVEQHRIGRLAGLEVLECRLAVREIDDLEALLSQVETQGFPKQIVVIDNGNALVVGIENGWVKRHGSIGSCFVLVVQ
jgi:hypothetical protein